MDRAAASFGAQPWWSYFMWAGRELIPPFSIAIIAVILYSFYKYPKNPIVLSFIPFVLIHILIGHKEPRFMFPLINGIPVLLALVYNGIQSVFVHGKKYWRCAFMLFWITNIVFLVMNCFKPASSNVQPFSYIYHHYNGKSATLIAFEYNPYVDIQLDLDYYKPKDIKVYDSIKPAQVDSVATKINGIVLVLSDNHRLDEEFTKAHPNAKLVYRNYPMWLDNFNFGHWINKTSMYKVYELKP